MGSLSIAELTRLLEYVPKETAPDIHEKIIAELTAKRFYEVTKGLSREKLWSAEESFIKGLSSYELTSWAAYTASLFPVEEG